MTSSLMTVINEVRWWLRWWLSSTKSSIQDMFQEFGKNGQN